MKKPKVAFICVHNSCRSQIAEALGKHLCGNEFAFYSAGTETKPQINQDAVRLMKELYGIDMEKKQYSKLMTTGNLKIRQEKRMMISGWLYSRSRRIFLN